ncbi:hypothetical protein [Jiangella sp. DSM 45060]|uniref:DUF6966 domain-containing protein n=1 Tax=Jiangella sp. DSM 45060 TaxID=1798224 RepID=UPI00087C7AA1|nr:hypothetical protein [Jiangella sp. DSM 45060]SDT70703.1 hypothetical protein SAMN04515669_6255 [Jiangella sp. DSM 45060]
MKPEDVRDDVARLAELLGEAVTLLERYGETRWASLLSASKRELLAGDAHGLLRLQNAFGGMGSLNDLLIMEANGHPVQRDDERNVNERLTALRSEISQLARKPSFDA